MKIYNNDRQIKIGDVYLVRFKGERNEQDGLRPAVIFQNNVGNTYSPNVIVLPMTSSLKKQSQLTHVTVPASSETGLKKDSMVLCENPVCVSKEKLGGYLTTIPKEYMEQIAVAYLLATSAICYVKPEILYQVWQKSKSLNKVAV